MQRYSFPVALLGLLALGLLVLDCQKTNAEDPMAAIADAMKVQIAGELATWSEASQRLADAAPRPEGRGWDTEKDALAIERMKRAWHEARAAYELIEGAIAATFPESDAATDARYDDFLARLGAQGDPNAFDDEGIVGMHAIERILWAPNVPEDVVRFERGLPGYRPARFPETAQEAQEFKEQLATGLTKEIERLRGEFTPLSLDVAFAYQGLIDLAVEQTEKVDRAASGQEESRYAQATMRDLRANYEGCARVYRVFQPFIQRRRDGVELDRRVLAAFDRLRQAYASVEGEAIPRPPEGWSTVTPNPVHRDSAFGRLYFAVKHESDPTAVGSLVHELSAVAKLLELKDVMTK